jgi:hypothetical protein
MNGILIHPNALRNLIRRNIIVGNPPVQVAPTDNLLIGADIRDSSPAGANTFEENLCITYVGVSPSPCPPMIPEAVMPKFAGHHNTSQSSSRNP